MVITIMHYHINAYWTIAIFLQCILFYLTGQNFSNDDTGEYVAIKILKDGVSNEVKEDFEREVDIMSAFDHENILKLIGIIQRGKNP